MYTVVSSHKPGRAALCKLLAALLLVGSTGAAWVLVRSRARPMRLDLTQTFQLASFPLVLHLPEGWVEREGSDSTPPGYAVFADAPDDRVKRRLFVTRVAWQQPFVPAETLGVQAAAYPVRRLFKAKPSGRFDVQSCSFGPLPGSSFRLDVSANHGSSRMACAVGSSPSGESYALILLSDGTYIDRDLKAVRALAEAVECTDFNVRDQAASDENMFDFTVPSGARIVEETDAHTDRVAMLSTRGSADSWYIQVTRTWLAEGRTPEQLFRDRVADSVAPGDVQRETRQLDQGPSFRGVLIREHMEVREFWVVPFGDHASLITGLAAPDSADALAAACLEVASSLREGSARTTLDVVRATARGRDVVESIGDRGMNHWWGAERVTEWWLRTGWEGPSGFIRAERNPVKQDDGRLGYSVVATSFSDPPLYAPQQSFTEWYIDSDLASDRGESVIQVDSDRGSYWCQSIESRRRGSNRLERSRTLKGRRILDSVDTAPNYVCEPATELAMYLVARSPEDGPAIFTQSTLFNHDNQMSTILCEPLGRTTADDFDAPSATWAVRVRSDYEPTALMIYFDDDGRMVRSVNEFGSRTEYSSLGEVREHFNDVRDLVRRIESLSKRRR
jgi:hypothetical protein